MKSGMTVERRDQVLMGFLSFDAWAASTFFIRWASQNGPFFSERVMSYPYFLPRRETIIEEVRLFERVFLPFVCWPQGDTGWRPAAARPSPPPCGWPTGFVTTHRPVGRRRRARMS